MFTTSKKFNLLGLSFTDDIVGNTANFSVIGERDDGVWFDKNGVTVADEQYHFAAFTPIVDASAPIPVAATIENATVREARIPVSWKLYAWDAGRLENLVAEGEQSVVIAPGSSAVASYTIQNAQHPVYLLVGTLQWSVRASISRRLCHSRSARESRTRSSRASTMSATALCRIVASNLSSRTSRAKSFMSIHTQATLRAA